MTALALLADLQARGVVLTARDDRLAFDAPAGMMTSNIRAAVSGRKPELLAVLSGDWKRAAGAMIDAIPDADRRADLRECFNERAGICEYQGLLPRDEAERAAYEQLAGVAQ